MQTQSKRAEREITRQALMDDEDVKLWRMNVGSEATGDNYWRMLAYFCEQKGQTPKSLLKLTDKAITDLVQVYMHEHGNQGAVTVKKAVASWLLHNDRKFTRDIKTPEAVRLARPRVDDMFIPTQDQLRQVFDAGDVRAKAALSVIAFAGQRLQVLGTYKGTDGLVLSDLKDLVIDGDKVAFKNPLAAKIVVRRPISKKRHEYFTFVGPEGQGYILAYLRERIENGETLTPRSPLMVPLQPNRKKLLTARSREDKLRELGRKPNVAAKIDNDRPFIRASNIGGITKKPMIAAGLHVPKAKENGEKSDPSYIWRSFFAHQGEMSQGLSESYRKFFEGRLGEVADDYSKHKGVTGEKLEVMRKAYASALVFLETERRPVATETLALTKIAELERQLQDLTAAQANPAQVTMREFREQAPVRDELAKARTDAMSPGELDARAKVDRLSQVLTDAMDDEGELGKSHEEPPMTRAEIIEMVKLGIMTKDEARGRLGLVVVVAPGA